MLSLTPQIQHKEGDKSWASNGAPTPMIALSPPEQMLGINFPRNLEGTNITHVVSE